jgi:hypothetical protein
VGLDALALIAPEPREAAGRSKLPGAGLLRAGNFERALEIGLRLCRVAHGRQQCDFASRATDFRAKPLLARRLGRLVSLINAVRGIGIVRADSL